DRPLEIVTPEIHARAKSATVEQHARVVGRGVLRPEIAISEYVHRAERAPYEGQDHQVRRYRLRRRPAERRADPAAQRQPVGHLDLDARLRIEGRSDRPAVIL